MNLTLLPDKELQERGSYLRPHYAIHSLSDLGKLNNNIKLPEVTVSILSNFINER